MNYAIKEVFNTLQGEGARVGARSVFVRFVGCNLWNGEPAARGSGVGACAMWCDTDFRKEGARRYSAEDLVQEMSKHWASDAERWCVLTGGEPLLQVDAHLVDVLRRAGWKIAIETNGTQRRAVEIDHVCVSPKLGGDVHPSWVGKVDELKVVLPGHVNALQGWSDAQLEYLRTWLLPRHCFVQPQDPPLSAQCEDTVLHRADIRLVRGQAQESYQQHLQRCIAFVMAHPRWRLCLQQHKVAGLR